MQWGAHRARWSSRGQPQGQRLVSLPCRDRRGAGGWKRTGGSRAGRVCSEPPWRPSPRTSCACFWGSSRCQRGRIPWEGEAPGPQQGRGTGRMRGHQGPPPAHPHCFSWQGKTLTGHLPNPGCPQTEGTRRRGSLKASQRRWLCVHLCDMSAVHSQCFSMELRLKRLPPA